LLYGPVGLLLRLPLLLATVAAYTLPGAMSPHTRREFLATGAAAVGWAATGGVAVAETLPSGLEYEVVKKGKGGGTPVVGDLISIRFKLVVKSSGTVIDDILSNPDGYYYRVGSGQVLPAVDQLVLKMSSGDVVEAAVPPALGFGPKGRSSSPGKPRIAGDAILGCTLELVSVPGKDEEVLEVTGGDLAP